MAFESTLYRLKVAQVEALPHPPTSPGACARGRAWPEARGGSRSEGRSASWCGCWGGGGACGGRWRDGAHFGMRDLRLMSLKPDRLI